MLRNLVLPLVLLFPLAHAEENHKGFEISRVMQITYGSNSWNTDSTKIDSAYIVLRDKATGKIVQIQLEETEPDSAEFSGHFSVNLGEKIQPEIYIPPKELRGGSAEDYKKLHDLIRTGKLQRKPVIWKRNEKGQAVLDVYDTREQAEAALKAFHDEERLAQKIKKDKPLKHMTDSAALAAAAAAQHKAELDRLALEAAQRETERVRLEQLEKQKEAERVREAQRLSEEEKSRRRTQAVQLSEEAMALYNQDDYAGAEDKFKQASALDPENKSYYYKYGVTLYKNKKYNEATVILKLSTVEPALQNEREYFIGLTHYRLAELENALGAFSEVAKSNDPQLGPSATFYRGVILYSQEKYEPAKGSFENVIDTSKDPKLDEQADSYLDKISRAMAYQKLRENKFTLMGTVGAMYDSNVLLNPSNAQGSGSPTNSPDFRLLTILDLQYRPIFTESNELTPHVSANLTNSAKAANAKADPFIYDISVPYTHKTKLGDKDYRFTVTPGYEWLFMDPNGTGTKSEEQTSYLVDLDNSFQMSPSWMSIYTAEFRNDTSFDPASEGPNNMSAKRYTLRTVQMFFLDKAKKTALMPLLAYAWNNAIGSNWTYTRMDVGATFLTPLYKDVTWNLSLLYYQMPYLNTSPKRVDNDYSLTTGFTKPIRDWVTWGVTGTYTENDSTDIPFAYNKYTIMTTATFNTNF